MKKLLMTLLMVLLCAPLAQAKIISQEIQYEESGVVLKGFLAYDDTIEDKAPGVLAVHEWWGHNDYVRKRATMLAELGYVAFAVDMYGDGKLATHPDDAGSFSGEVMSKVDSVLKPRFLAALDFLKSQENVETENIVAIGYCFGGSTVLHVARLGIDLKGVVSFHGGLSTPVKAKKDTVKPKILICHGKDDTFVSPEDIANFHEEMTSANVSYEFNEYEGAKHSFTSKKATEIGKKFDLPLEYNKKADKQSWEDMKEFLKDVFVD